MQRLLPLLLLVPLLGCAPTLEPLPFEPAGAAAAPDPSAFGPFPVGVRTLSFVDDTRTTPGYEGPRTLVTEIWYPADEAARAEPGESYVLYDALPDDIKAKLQPTDLGTLETAGVRDAAPRTDRGAFPVVLFSHGKGGIRMQSTYYTVALASHGYVVVAPDHQGDTIIDLLEAGDVDVTTSAQSYIDRPVDMSFLLNELQRLDDDDPLKPLLDLSRVGASGHSFGALTSMISAGQDLRVKVAVAQSPVGVALVNGATPVPLDDFGKPIMIQSGGEDRTLPEDRDAQSLWDHMKSPRAWESLARAGHFTYSDLCILDVAAIDAALEIDASNVLEDGCGPENTPPEVAFPLINMGAIGFFNVHLRESAASSKWLAQGALDDVAAGEATIQQ